MSHSGMRCLTCAALAASVAAAARAQTPPNDDCASSSTLGAGTHSYSNIGATTDGPALTSCYGGDELQNDVWYDYTPLGSGMVTVSLCGDPFFVDTMVAVYSGCSCPVNQRDEIACDDDFCDIGAQSQVSFCAVAGQCYRIRIGGWEGSTGAGTFTIALDSTDSDGDGAPLCADCDDSDPSNAPGSVESCDGQDNNCDGQVDERCTSCVADLSGDGVVGPADLGQLLAQWGSDPSGPPDFNDDDIVGAADLAELLAQWGEC